MISRPPVDGRVWYELYCYQFYS